LIHNTYPRILKTIYYNLANQAVGKTDLGSEGRETFYGARMVTRQVQALERVVRLWNDEGNTCGHWAEWHSVVAIIFAITGLYTLGQEK
jgi:hypothetical protein